MIQYNMCTHGGGEAEGNVERIGDEMEIMENKSVSISSYSLLITKCQMRNKKIFNVKKKKEKAEDP